MKTKLFFLVTIALTFLFVFCNPVNIFSQSQVNHKPVDKEKDMLCHKWNISNSNDSIGIFPGAALSTIQFNPDGYVIFTAGKQVQGVWNYDETRNNLFIIVNNKLWKFTVLSLTNGQMVLVNKQYKSAVKNFLWRSNL